MSDGYSDCRCVSTEHARDGHDIWTAFLRRQTRSSRSTKEVLAFERLIRREGLSRLDKRCRSKGTKGTHLV